MNGTSFLGIRKYGQLVRSIKMQIIIPINIEVFLACIKDYLLLSRNRRMQALNPEITSTKY